MVPLLSKSTLQHHRNFTKYCRCHEKWYSNITQCCACHSNHQLTSTPVAKSSTPISLQLHEYCHYHEKRHCTITKYSTWQEKLHSNSSLHCSTLLYSTLLLYCSLLVSSLFYSSLPFSSLLYSSTLLFSTFLYSSLLFSTLLYSSLRISALLYSTLSFSTLLFSTSLSHFLKLRDSEVSHLNFLWMYLSQAGKGHDFGQVASQLARKLLRPQKGEVTPSDTCIGQRSGKRPTDTFPKRAAEARQSQQGRLALSPSLLKGCVCTLKGERFRSQNRK